MIRNHDGSVCLPNAGMRSFKKYEKKDEGHSKQPPNKDKKAKGKKTKKEKAWEKDPDTETKPKKRREPAADGSRKKPKKWILNLASW